MKQIRILSLALCLALFLTACTKAEDPDNLFETNQTPSQSVPDAFSAAREKSTAPAQPEGSAGDYPYGNMQKNAPPGDFMLYEGRVVFFQNRLLYAFDPAAEEVSLLCRDATCTHISCVSGAPFGNLEQYDGTLYALNSAWQIAALENEKLEPLAAGGVYSFWHANGQLYAVTQDGSLIAVEKGGKTHILADEYTSIWNVVFGHYLYGNTSKGVTRVDLSAPQPEVEYIIEGDVSQLVDGAHIYYTDYAEAGDRLYRCDLDGGSRELLLEQRVLPASWNFDEEYLYFRLYGDDFFEGDDSLGFVIYRMKKEDPASLEPLAEFPECVYQIYIVPGYDKLFVKKRGEGVYLVNKDGSGFAELEFPNA